MKMMTSVRTTSLLVLFLISYWETGNSLDTNVCDLPKEKGTCSSYSVRYYFNIKTGQCVQFQYSGCNGNDNNFRTMEECTKACEKRVCTLPKLKGSCYNNREVQTWFYDAKEMLCKPFLYSGCNGNKNRFKTKKSCIELCTGVKPDPCGAIPPCAPPPPFTCPGFTYEIINGVKCITGCTYPLCKKNDLLSSVQK